jgi:hypothetical protein
MRLDKRVIWDYENLTQLITTAIRNTGYTHTIDITYQCSANAVTAYSSSSISKVAQNTCGRIFCVLSCLWIIFLPAYLLSRKTFEGHLEAYYLMREPVAMFYAKNINFITSAVTTRNRNRNSINAL